jgi:molecular chaperone GrpE
MEDSGRAAGPCKMGELMEQPQQPMNANGGQRPADAPTPQDQGSPRAPSPDLAQAPPADTVEALQQQLSAAREASDENLRGWQRSQADFVNFRRRVEQERSDLVKLAESAFVLDVLPVLDDMERALAGVPPELHGLTWVDGVALIWRKLQAALEMHGVTPIEALGKEFDPNEHEAVMRDGEPDEATVVTGQLQRGYRMRDRVIRPALVKVGPPPPHSSQGSNGS